MNEAAKKRSNKWKWLTLAALLLIAFLFVAAYFFFDAKLTKIQYDTDSVFSGSAMASEPERGSRNDRGFGGFQLKPLSGLATNKTGTRKAQQSDITQVLLIGTDEQSFAFNERASADCTMLISLNPGDKKVSLISFDPDLRVAVQTGTNAGRVEELSHCFRQGGADLMLEEIRASFNVDVDRYVRVNFGALVKTVDILGGIEVELSESEAATINQKCISGKYSYNSVHVQTDLTAGKNCLYGPAALCYVQNLMRGNEYYRMERQRKFMQSCVSKAKDANISTLNYLADEVFPLIRTNFSEDEIRSLLLDAPKFVGVTFDCLSVSNDQNRGSAAKPDYEECSGTIRELIYDN